jgi:hypothetical protein
MFIACTKYYLLYSCTLKQLKKNANKGQKVWKNNYVPFHLPAVLRSDSQTEPHRFFLAGDGAASFSSQEPESIKMMRVRVRIDKKMAG